MERRNERANEGRLAGAEATREGDDVARTQARRQRGGRCGERVAVEKGENVRGHITFFDEENVVLVRLNDVVVGVIAGGVCAVVAAAFEAGIVALRFFSIGHLGSHFGTTVVILALAGATIGGIVGLSIRPLFAPRDVPSRVRVR
jgi:hypothetical protein